MGVVTTAKSLSVESVELTCLVMWESYSFSLYLLMTDDGGNVSTPSSFIESHYAPKSQKEVFKSKMDSPSDVFADVDPFLELDYVAAVAGAEDSLVPVHISDSHESSAMTQSMTTSFETDLTVPQENGYSDGTSALTYSVSSGHNLFGSSCGTIIVMLIILKLRRPFKAAFIVCVVDCQAEEPECF